MKRSGVVFLVILVIFMRMLVKMLCFVIGVRILKMIFVFVSLREKFVFLYVDGIFLRVLWV